MVSLHVSERVGSDLKPNYAVSLTREDFMDLSLSLKDDSGKLRKVAASHSIQIRKRG